MMSLARAVGSKQKVSLQECIHKLSIEALAVERGCIIRIGASFKGVVAPDAAERQQGTSNLSDVLVNIALCSLSDIQTDGGR